jgi:signal transduction histidine kinase
MMPTTQAAMGFVYGSGFFAVLLVGLALAAALGAYVWRRTGSPPAQFTALGSASLLACIAMWAALTGLFSIGDVDPRLWVAPFDRMLLIVSTLALAWTATAGSRSARRWRPYLVGALGATLLMYLHWATTWAREVSLASNAVTVDPTGMARAWDVALAVLAIATAVVVWRWVPKAPHWIAWVLGGIAIGSLMEIAAPMNPLLPAWSRLGAVGAGLVFVGAALVQTADLIRHDAPSIIPFELKRRDAADEVAPPLGTGAESTDPDDLLPDLDLGLAPDVLADQALLTMADHLGADPCVTCLLEPSGDFDVRACGGGNREPRRIAALPMADYPTLRRALHEGALSLRRASVAPDIERLYTLMGADSNGPVMLQRIGSGQAYGVLLAGRANSNWSKAHQALLLAIGARVAVALDAIPNRAVGTDLPIGAPAADVNAELLGRLSRIVEHVGQRVEEIESQIQTPDGAPVQTDLRSETSGAGATADDAARNDAATAEASLAVDSESEAPETEASDTDSPEFERPETNSLETESNQVEELQADSIETSEDESAATAALEPQPTQAEVEIDDHGPREVEANDPEAQVADTEAPDAPFDTHLAALVPQYERALERVPWGVAVLDSEGRVAYANEAASSLLHRDELSPLSSLADAVPSPDRLSRALRQLKHRTGSADTADTEPIEVRFTAPDVRIELEPLTDPVEGYIGALATVHPCVSSDALSAEDLVPALADAIRAPMTSILGYSDLLTCGPGVPEEQLGRFLHRIDANLARMQVMLENLLAVLEMEQAPMVPEAVDVPRTIERAVSRARAQFEEKALDVNYDAAGELPPASAEPEAVRQIIDNLLMNAATRSPQGGDVMVDAQMREADGTRAIVVSVHDRGSQLTDAGSGVVEIDETSSAPVALRIVRVLAARQGGRAWAQSDKHGARFFVRLPVRETEAA